MGFNMPKLFKAYPSVKDRISPNDDEFEDNIVLDEDEELEERYIPNIKKMQKRIAAVNDSKKNKWRIKE